MNTPICPHCKINLQRSTHKSVFKYYCFKCAGLATHVQNLRKILNLENKTKLNELCITANQSLYKCSHCTQKMHAINLLDTQINLDFCKSCQVFWFDKGEWTSAEAAYSTKEPSNTLQFDKLFESIKAESVEHKVHQLSLEKNKIKYTLASFGLLSEVDKDTFLTEPIITWAILAVVAFASLLSFSNFDMYLIKYGFIANLNFADSILRMLSSFFLHTNLVHLFLNLYFLWLFGDNVEDYLGKFKFLFLLVISIIGSCTLFSFFSNANHYLVGTSGAISGLIGFYVLRFPKRMFFVIGTKGVVSFSTMQYAGVFIFGQVLLSLLNSNDLYLAHIGGFFSGVLFFFLDSLVGSEKN